MGNVGQAAGEVFCASMSTAASGTGPSSASFLSPHLWELPLAPLQDVGARTMIQLGWVNVSMLCHSLLFYFYFYPEW